MEEEEEEGEEEDAADGSGDSSDDMEVISLADDDGPEGAPGGSRGDGLVVTADEGTESGNESLNKPAVVSPFELDFERRLNRAAAEDTSAWLIAYKQLMNKSIKQFHILLESQRWELLAHPDGIQLYERVTSASKFYTIKTRAVLDVRAERLMYVVRDFDPKTRLQWDANQTASVNRFEQFETDEGPIVVAQREMRLGIPLVSNRVFLGIYWCGYDGRTRVYKYVFRTTQHRMHKCPRKKVAAIALIGVVVRVLDPPDGVRHQCEIIIVEHANLGQSLPDTIVNSIKAWLCDRIALYERVVKNWDTYYGPAANPRAAQSARERE